MAFLRLLIATLFVLLNYVLAGGHLHVLWWPFHLMMVVGMYAGFYTTMVGMKRPRNADPVLLWRVGKIAFWPAAVVPKILSTFIALSSGPIDPELQIRYFIPVFVTPMYSIFIFAACFRPVPNEKA